MSSRRKIGLGIGFGTLLILGVGGYIMWPRLRTFIPLPVAHEPMQADGSYTNIIFLHHSTGTNLIAQGNVRPLLSELGYQFWDHGYNYQGLVRPDGTRTGTSYRIPGNMGRGNTDVDGLAALFKQPVAAAPLHSAGQADPPNNAFSRLLQHEVIVVKSCFPNSAVKDEAMQRQFQAWYLEIRDVIGQHPDRIFILVTSPPLHPLATNAEEASRARAVANWLKSDEYLAGQPNLFVFDLFDLLADPATHTLRSEYQLSADKRDSHPNRVANETIGPLFVAFIDQAIKTFTSRLADD